ncbi:MAG TPA: LamG-like jellyroll fold domain-containing protein [Candidatus Limnocylindria bacterium]|nr:LamG-like jellyroll fold domain-containing protein [Candidatus Limnocylindria bacterium]
MYTTAASDLTLPGRLLSFGFSRTYNSADLTPGPLGRGWTHSYNWTLSENGSLVVIRRGDGRQDSFTRNQDGTYADPPGVFDLLTQHADGTFTLTTPAQVAYEFNSPTQQQTANLALGAPVMVSRGWQGANVPHNGDDGNTGTAFQQVNGSMYGDGQYCVDLGAGTVSQWRFLAGGGVALGGTYNLDGSNGPISFADNGTNGDCGQPTGTHGWTNIASGPTPLDTGRVTLSPAQTYRYWRLAFGGVSSGCGVCVNEFELWGSALAPTAGRLARIHEPAGNAVSLSYTGGDLTSITDTVGRQVTLSYDANHHLASLSDPSGRKVSYGYDAQGRLSGVWDKAANATLNYRAAVQVDSPAGYWKFDESSGTSVTDEVAVQAGTSFGGATRGMSGIAGTAATQFDGSSGYVSIPSNAAFNFGTGDWSIEAWLYRTGTGRDNFPVVMSKRPWQVASEPGWAITVPTTDPTKVALHVDNRDVNDVGMQTPTGLITANTWHHLALVYTAADLVGRLYLDGALVLTTPATDGAMGASNSVALTIGRNNAGTGDYLDGRVDEVAVYNHALSATRVAAHYAANPAASWHYTYDGQSQHLTTITDPDARVVLTNAYDTLGRLASRKDGRQKQTTFAYGTGTTTITDPRGHATTATFDPRQRVIEVDPVPWTP